MSQVFGLAQLIASRWREGRRVIAVTIDLKKAFDTIDHRVLKASLQKKNIMGRLLSAIMGKYQNRRARIKANGDAGATVKGTWWREVSIGVRNRCVICQKLGIFATSPSPLCSDWAQG